MPSLPSFCWSSHLTRKQEGERIYKQKAVESYSVERSEYVEDQTMFAHYSMNASRLSSTTSFLPLHSANLYIPSISPTSLFFQSVVPLVYTAWIPLQQSSWKLQQQQQQQHRPTEKLQKQEDQFSPGVPEWWGRHTDACMQKTVYSVCMKDQKSIPYKARFCWYMQR